VAHSLASWAGNGGLRVLRNNWPAPFVDVTASLALPSLQAWAVVTIDIDRDGRRDLLVGNASGNGLVLLRAVGAGFVDETALRLPTVLQPIASIVVLDFDGDGWPDIACRDRWGGMPQELRNTAGVLAVVPNPFTLFGGSLPRHPAAADFDGDGDQDLITAFGLLENRVRDLHSTAPPRLGRNGELVLRAHAGDGVNPQLAALFIAAAPASPPLPLPGLGTLRLDPATAAFHSMHTISATGGEVSFVYLVPAVPALLGSVVYAQALFVHEPNPATWRLGNMVRLPVRL
jgi:hypothetical protein